MRWLMVTLIVVLWLRPAIAGSLEGRVVEMATGSPQLPGIPGVIVKVIIDGQSRTTVTDGDGRYRLDNLDPDKKVSVEYSKPGYYEDPQRAEHQTTQGVVQAKDTELYQFSEDPQKARLLGQRLADKLVDPGTAEQLTARLLEAPVVTSAKIELLREADKQTSGKVGNTQRLKELLATDPEVVRKLETQVQDAAENGSELPMFQQLSPGVRGQVAKDSATKVMKNSRLDEQKKQIFLKGAESRWKEAGALDRSDLIRQSRQAN